MGNLLRLLSSPDVDSCCSVPRGVDLFVDFESAKVTIEQEQLYNETEEVLHRANDIMQHLLQYKGASKEIREAISNPNSDSETAAWSALKPLVLKLRLFYEFSKELGVIVPKLLDVLAAPNQNIVNNRLNLLEHLDDHQALVKQFSKLLDFVLRFDECKMTTPAVQNDFSYYRRTVQRRSFTTSDGEPDIPIPIDVGNSMSLFLAHATPMLLALSGVITQYVGDNSAHGNSGANVAHNTTEILSIMAKVCQRMLDTPDLKSRLRFEETELFILRVMIAAIILYDHVHHTGAFAKSSSVDVKGCVRVLREYDKSHTESLLNALRYTTKHLNEESTPKSIKAIIFEEVA